MILLTKAVATKATLAGLGFGIAAGLALAAAIHGMMIMETRK